MFNLQQGQYAWLKPENPPSWANKTLINRDYLEADIALELPLRMSAFVHIEAGFDNGQPWREIDWLEQHCSLPFRSVAYGDLTLKIDSFTAQIAQLCRRQSVTGIRHILDDQALALLSKPATLRHFSLLQDHGLSFDAQLSLSDDLAVSALVKVIEQTPDLKVIINHGGWAPAFKHKAQWQTWADNLKRLSSYPQVAIKLSGWEMTNVQWTIDDIQPVLELCIGLFSDRRVMLASNFPLCHWRCSLQELWLNYMRLIGQDNALITRLCSENAAIWYQLQPA